MAWRYDADTAAAVKAGGRERLVFRGRVAGDQLSFSYEADDIRLPVLVTADDVTEAGIRRWLVDYDWVVRDWGGGFAEAIPEYIEQQDWWPDRALWQGADEAIETALLIWPATPETGPSPVFLKRRGGFLGYGWTEWMVRYTLPPQPMPITPETPFRYLLGPDVPQWGEPDWMVPYIMPQQSDASQPMLFALATGNHIGSSPTSSWRRPQKHEASRLQTPIISRVLLADCVNGASIRTAIQNVGYGRDATEDNIAWYESHDGNALAFRYFHMGTRLSTFGVICLDYLAEPLGPTLKAGQFPGNDGLSSVFGQIPPVELLWKSLDFPIISALSEISFNAVLDAGASSLGDPEPTVLQKALSVRSWGGYFNGAWSDPMELNSRGTRTTWMGAAYLQERSRKTRTIPLFRELVRDLRRLKR